MVLLNTVGEKRTENERFGMQFVLFLLLDVIRLLLFGNQARRELRAKESVRELGERLAFYITPKPSGRMYTKPVGLSGGSRGGESFSEST